MAAAADAALADDLCVLSDTPGALALHAATQKVLLPVTDQYDNAVRVYVQAFHHESVGAGLNSSDAETVMVQQHDMPASAGRLLNRCAEILSPDSRCSWGHFGWALAMSCLLSSCRWASGMCRSWYVRHPLLARNTVETVTAFALRSTGHTSLHLTRTVNG